MKNINIVLFSSGVTEKNGVLARVEKELYGLGYRCFFWKDLFGNAHDENNIALLPMLIKKIPTFDYAVILCDGHDETRMLRNGEYLQVNSMRDNVLFEIGLCSMALGLSKVILLADPDVHLPDDLTGIGGNTAVKRIACKMASGQEIGADIIAQIDEYIHETHRMVTPVVIGAAASLACGYISNFIFRTLESIKKGFDLEGEHINVAADKVHMHIMLPEVYNDGTAEKIKEIKSQYKVGSAAARDRRAEFRYRMAGDELHIYDWPTNIVTSYDTAKMILNIDADDEFDTYAVERFTAKELDLFEKTLGSLLNCAYLRQCAENFYPSMDEKEKKAMLLAIEDVIAARLYVETY